MIPDINVIDMESIHRLDLHSVSLNLPYKKRNTKKYSTKPEMLILLCLLTLNFSGETETGRLLGTGVVKKVVNDLFLKSFPKIV